MYVRPMARENIDIDRHMLDVVMRRYGLRATTEAVDFALRRLAGTPMTVDDALDMRGAELIGDVPADTAG